MHQLQSHKQLADTLEQDHAEGRHDHENVEESQASQEEVRCLDAGPEGDPLDAVDDVAAIRSLNGPLGEPAGRPLDKTNGGIQKRDGTLDLLNLYGDGVECVEDSRGLAASRPLVPREDVLDESDLDDAHTPLEILGPRFHNRRKRHSAESKHGLGLKVAKQRKGVGGDVRGSIGKAQTVDDGRGNKGEDGHASRGPFHTDEINCSQVSIGPQHT